MAKDSAGKRGRILLAGLILALSVPFGFVIALVVTPFLWWMEIRAAFAFTAQPGPKLYVIVLSVLFVWGVLYAISAMVIRYRRNQR